MYFPNLPCHISQSIVLIHLLMSSFMFSDTWSLLSLYLRVIHIFADSVGLIITLCCFCWLIKACCFMHFALYLIMIHVFDILSQGVSKCIYPGIIYTSARCLGVLPARSILNQNFGLVIVKSQKSISFGPHSCENCLGVKIS